MSAACSAAASRSRSCGANAVHVVDVAGLVVRRLDETREQLGVARGGLAALRVPRFDVAQEDPQERRLERVEARVVADVLELLLRPRAVEAQHPQPLGERSVVDGDQPAVAKREQVLGREEAERRRDARRDPACAERLGGVFDHRQAEADRRSGAGRPNRCTGMIAFVRSVIRRSTSAGSRLSVAGSISAKTGVAPRRAIASAVA